MLSKKIIAKLVVLCCLAFGFIYLQPSVAAKSDCPPYCPFGYACNYVTGECECICPNPDGSCPMSCA